MVRKRLSDEDFLATYHAVGENGAALAREIGVSPQAAYKRLRKLGAEVNPAGRGAKQKLAGRSIVAVEAVIQGSPPLKAGAVEATKGLLSLDRLAACMETIDAMVARVNTEVDAQGGKYRPYQVDQLIKLMRESRATVESVHNIKKSLFDLKGMQAFMEAVIRIMERFEPEIQEQIYLELVSLGREEQIASLGG